MLNLLRNISHRSWFVLYRNILSYQRYIFSTFVASFGEPLLYMLSMGVGLGSYMGLINGMPYLQFLAPGLVVSSCMSAASYECTFSAFSRMHMERIYDSQVVTPVSVEDIVVGEILWGMLRSVLSGIVIVTIILLFGLVHSRWALLYPLVWLLVGFIFSSIALVATSFAKNFDFFTFYIELFIMPMFFFSGIFFPLDRFPQIFQTVANIFPLAHAVVISRALVNGNVSWGLLGHAAYLLFIGGIFFILALARMKKRLVN